MSIELPRSLSINAFTGVPGEETSEVGPKAKVWGIRQEGDRPGFMAAGEIELRDWRDPDIGWGLLLPENKAITEAERLVGADAPEPIRDLLAARPGSPIFRYSKGSDPSFLRRYYQDKPRQDISVFGKRGIAPGKFPHYLLIVGSPVEIPWEVQFFLNQACFVGRLDLDLAGLTNYVAALKDDFKTSTCKPSQPVVWAVNHGNEDITSLMRGAIAAPLKAEFDADNQIGPAGVRWLTDAQATVADLEAALAERRPAVVITTSHGMTGPLDDAAKMGEQLGLLVDGNHQLLDPGALLAAWAPDGAVWFAQACCSAGCDGVNRYKDLVVPTSSVDRILDAVAAVGPRVAPLPKALLGAEKPLRAFIGQVDPTFDWTLRATNRQIVTDGLNKSIYPNMHFKDPETVGLSFDGYYAQVGALFRKHEIEREKANAMQPGARTSAVDARLTARDRESLVILGDPTVAVPPLP